LVCQIITCQNGSHFSALLRWNLSFRLFKMWFVPSFHNQFFYCAHGSKLRVIRDGIQGSLCRLEILIGTPEGSLSTSRIHGSFWRILNILTQQSVFFLDSRVFL
jgi:hypothetical protein